MSVQDGGAATLEPIVVRGNVGMAERIYTSGRGDYIAYLYGGKVYTVRTPLAARGLSGGTETKPDV